MTNEEAKAFLDNLKICIDEHPIVADWLVEIADRKTEPSNIVMPKAHGRKQALLMIDEIMTLADRKTEQTESEGE